MKLNHKGFALVEALLIAVALLAIAGAVNFVWSKNSSDESKTENTLEIVDPEQSEKVNDVEISNVLWSFDGKGWSASSDPPECPAAPYMQSPADLSKVTGILYPGQYRGDDYKTHGGFRFDSSPSRAINVTIPMDANLISASRYFSSIVSGDPQYFLIFISPCGIMYRIDHVTKFTDKFQKYMDTLPEAKIDDSRTTDFNPVIPVKVGELLGIEIGFPGNAFFDFGVNDLRSPNEQSKDPVWAGEHDSAIQYNYFGVCWFDLLPAADAEIVRGLPAGGNEGKVSDYCG